MGIAQLGQYTDREVDHVVAEAETPVTDQASDQGSASRRKLDGKRKRETLRQVRRVPADRGRMFAPAGPAALAGGDAGAGRSAHRVAVDEPGCARLMTHAVQAVPEGHVGLIVWPAITGMRSKLGREAACCCWSETNAGTRPKQSGHNL
jgi:hypothetical protein